MTPIGFVVKISIPYKLRELMSAMTGKAIQTRIVEIKNAPDKIQKAAALAYIAGIISLFRILSQAYLLHYSMWTAVLLGLLTAIWYFAAGIALYSRKKLGFILLIVIAVFPVYGLCVKSIYLLRMILQGSLIAGWPEAIHGILTFLQLIAVGILLLHLGTCRKSLTGNGS
jgi:hypothetical protein